MVALLRAYHAGWTTAAMLSLGAVAALSRSTLVSIPLVQEMIPARVILGILAATVALTPLYGVFPEFQRTLIREFPLRLVRLLASLGLAAFAIAPSFADNLHEPGAISELRLVLLLVAIGVAAVVLVGDYAWLLVLGTGFVAIMVTVAPGNIITFTLTHASPPYIVVALLIAAVAYVGIGPSSRRTAP